MPPGGTLRAGGVAGSSWTCGCGETQPPIIGLNADVLLFDGSRAVASLVHGELRILLPKIHDRRGVARVLPITTVPQA